MGLPHLPKGTVPVLTFIAGQVAAIGLEWFRVRANARVAARVKVSDFQRTTLLDLSDRLAEFTDSQVAFLHQLADSIYGEYRSDDDESLSEAQRRTFKLEGTYDFRIFAQLHRLRSRVADDGIRKRVEVLVESPARWMALRQTDDFRHDAQDDVRKLRTLAQLVAMRHGDVQEEIGTYLSTPQP